MAFELKEVTKVTCTHANTRVELHGKTEKIRAIDLRWRLTGENTLLDLIQPGLREHFYRNKAVEDAVAAGQQRLMPDEVIPLPNLRFPLLPAEGVKWADKAYRGYRWRWDWGTEADHYDFIDVAVSNITIESMQEGGTVSILFTTQYNGEELNDNATYGELAGLAAMGELHIQLLAPAELLPVKKGWRAGKADPSPARTDGGAPLLEGAQGPGDDDHDDDDTGGQLEEGSPEAALAGAVAGGVPERSADEEAQQNHAAVWPFPDSAHDDAQSQSDYPTPPTPEKPRRGGRRAAAAA
jgi:hypothetical protein